MNRLLLIRLLLSALVVGNYLSLSSAVRAGDPKPFRVPPAMPDGLELPSPASVHLQGFLGTRVLVNESNRLAKVDVEPLLAGFRKKPGVHPWIGEHIGKWMHAATLAWATTDDPDLRAKLDYAVSELIKAQEPDGYLGTYVPGKRFGLHEGSDWDVWSHKYNLMGLLTYYQYTGNELALTASRKMGDLLINTFGPGKKSILSAGTHMGMAATSVLEPIVLLYRFTADERYLEFAKYIVSSWDEAKGPKILKTLLAEKNVQKTANAKAYEMLSNLVGLCELARVTGNREYLQAALNAWGDVVAHRLYLTGSASQGEHFRDDFFLPNEEGANVAETCVTTTWIQLNSQLLRLTGEARFGNELEKTFYNHLAAAQRPDGKEWCYFTSLQGKKPYGPGINCCVSSGPRGMALVPQHAWLKSREYGQDGLVLNLFDSSRSEIPINGSPVVLSLSSEFPLHGVAVLAIGLKQSASFALRLREPTWAAPLQVEINGQKADLSRDENGWALIRARQWKNGDRVTLGFALAGRMILGEHGNKDKAALTWGPLVLAYDDKRNEDLPRSQSIGLVAENDRSPVTLKPGKDLAFTATVRSPNRPQPFEATFVPFAEAGRDGGTYRVWLRAPGAPIPQNTSLLAPGQESRSRSGNVEGSIIDGDPGTFVLTFNGRKADEDWFAVTLDEPIAISRVVFAPGKIFHDGGWFDASEAKPRIQVRRTKGARWETVAEISSYPETTATDPADLGDGQRQSFITRFSETIKAVAVRVIGKPASGDNPNQAFSSCGELMAFDEP
jgi:uncharacterized protein